MNNALDFESSRVAALARQGVLDTPREHAFDEILSLAAALCRAPVAVVNFISKGRQLFKAEVGLGVRETPPESSFRARAFREGEMSRPGHALWMRLPPESGKWWKDKRSSRRAL